MLPLLVVSFTAVVLALGGPGTIHAHLVAVEPTALSLTNGQGLRFGLYVGLALLGASILNQGLWQRVYAAESDRTVQKGFVVAAVGVVPVVFLSGLFGLSAAGFGLASHGGHSAFFLVLLEFSPEWVVLLALVTAVLLVMTTVDTLLSGLTSLALHDLPQVIDYLDQGHDPDDGEGLLAARCITGTFTAIAVTIGAFQISEIRLFLFIDLLCAATFVPVVVGAYTGEVPEWGAVTAAIGGWGIASVFDPAFRSVFALSLPESLLTTLPTPSFTASFVTAVVCSITVTSLSAVLSRETTDLNHLEDQIKMSGDGPGENT
jgi:hypothetical protein